MFWQIALILFQISWLVALLVLLFLIWRSSEQRLKHIQSMEVTLFDVAKKDAETAQEAVKTTQSLVASIQALITIIQEEKHVDH